MKTLPLILMAGILASAQGPDRAGLPLPPPGNVTLPLEEYNKLVELAAKPAKKPEAPPVAYAIKQAELKLQVEGESASAGIQLDGEVFAKGTVSVPLVTGIAVFDARQVGKDLPLELERGTHTAVLTGPAEFSILLDGGLPLSVEAGRASLSLPVPAAGTARLTLSIPGDHTDVNLRPGLITARTSDGGRTGIEATLVPGQPVSIWWTTRENSASPAPRESRFLSDVKTLVSVNEEDLGIASLVDITVVRGEPGQFEISIPAGYEVTGTSGATLESSDLQQGLLSLKVNGAAQRSHQFLISLERPMGETKAEVPFLTVKGTEREIGEVLVEGEGAMELTAKESGALKRMDLKETSMYLRTLAHDTLQAAFRYRRQPAEEPKLSLEWVRFPDSKVLAAVVQRAVVTTLVTSEGKSLTEVTLNVRNQAQPFLKVTLPAGAGILTAEVAGEKVKPVQGADGDRVPLLRPGFRPAGAYAVSFVFLHSGAPFAKKGGSELSLPSMDVPIGLLQWEVFLPERFQVKDFGGDAVPANLLPVLDADTAAGEMETPVPGPLSNVDLDSLGPGQIGGVVVDASGAVIPGVRVTAEHPQTGTVLTTVSNGAGQWLVAGVPAGRVRLTAEARGFRGLSRELTYDPRRPFRLNLPLAVGNVSETIAVTSEADMLRESRQIESDLKKGAAAPQNQASANVMNLQRRVAGVLPISVDVPRAGASYRFVRPLVLDEETKVTFNYKTR